MNLPRWQDLDKKNLVCNQNQAPKKINNEKKIIFRINCFHSLSSHVLMHLSEVEFFRCDLFTLWFAHTKLTEMNMAELISPHERDAVRNWELWTCEFEIKYEKWNVEINLRAAKRNKFIARNYNQSSRARYTRQWWISWAKKKRNWRIPI